MARRLTPVVLPVVLLAAALPAAVPALADSTVSPAASDPSVTDVTPLTTKLDASKRHTEFFSASFQAEAGEVRFVATELVVKDAKNTAPDELFVGVTLSCTSPSGRVTSAEAGRNVWPAASTFTVPVGFTMQTDVAGTYKCLADVMMCDPGNCGSPTGTGVVFIVTRKANPKNYSLLYITAALPSWAQSTRVPTTGDRLLKPGQSLAMNGTFDVSGSSTPVRVGGIFSITNCIVKAYPTACKGAGKTATQGSSTVTVSLRLTQQATIAGTQCTTAKATASDGAGTSSITWQQHHAVFNIYVPDFDLSSDPGCGSQVSVAATVTAGKGNAIVVESGSKSKMTSVIYAIPGDSMPAGV